MNIGSTFANISTSYTVKINEEESLQVTREKVVKSPDEQKKEELKEAEDKSSIKSNAAKELSVEEEQLVKDLSARDTEVRAHEAAHQAAGGGMTGSASMTYQQGPDGKMYAIGGEVSISMKSGSTPEDTIANARQVQAAAMAPAEPSSQDFAVASSARVMEIKAQQQLAREQQEEKLGKEAYKNETDPNEEAIDPLESIDLSA